MVTRFEFSPLTSKYTEDEQGFSEEFIDLVNDTLAQEVDGNRLVQIILANLAHMVAISVGRDVPDDYVLEFVKSSFWENYQLARNTYQGSVQ